VSFVDRFKVVKFSVKSTAYGVKNAHFLWISNDFTTVHFESLFTLVCNNKGTRGHLAKLSKPRCQKDVRKYFFSHRWNALDGETVSCSSINAFKNRLNKIRMTRMGYFMD